MNFSLCSDGLKLFNGESALFCDFKAYIMTEQNEKTYLEFVSCDEKSAEFALEEAGARLKLELKDVNDSCAIRIIAEYKPEKQFSKKNNIHFYDEHAAGIEMRPCEDMDNFTAIYKHCEFWCRVFFAESADQLPETTQALLMPYSGFNMFAAALCDKEYKGNFMGGTDGRFSLYVWDNCHSNSCDTTAAVISTGDNWDTLIPRVMADGFTALGKKPLMRKDKKLPEALNWFGWCTWDALHLDVSHGALCQKAQEFADKNIPVKWVMIDDMWGHVKNNALGVNSTRELYDFEADPDRFPQGLAGAVRDLKEKYRLTVGLWHPTTGYWRGIDPHGKIANNPRFKDLLFWSQFGFLTHSFEAKKIEKYFMRQHKFYKKCGIDFVKVDNQACLRRWAKLVMPIGTAARNMHAAIEKAADTYYGGQLINCMGMPLENFWNRKSAVSRMSCDYLPDSVERFNLLIQQNTFNSMVQGTVYYGDYDMWWTYDSQAQKNAAIHAICGGPVYVSDEIGKTNFSVIAPLLFDDGRIIRMENPANPTKDCLFVNSQKSGKPFKVYNKSERGGVVIAYNIDEENREVVGGICAADAGLSADDYYCAYDRITGEACYVKGDQTIDVTLSDNNQFKMILFVPCRESAIIGIKEKYVCFELIKDGHALENGTLLLYKAPSVMIGGKEVNTHSIGNDLYEISVKRGEIIALCKQ